MGGLRGRRAVANLEAIGRAHHVEGPGPGRTPSGPRDSEVGQGPGTLATAGGRQSQITAAEIVVTHTFPWCLPPYDADQCRQKSRPFWAIVPLSVTAPLTRPDGRTPCGAVGPAPATCRSLRRPGHPTRRPPRPGRSRPKMP